MNRISDSATSSESLRIGIAAHVLGRQKTGIERVMTNLITAMRAESGHDLVLYLTDDAAAARWQAKRLPRTEVRVLRFGHPASRLAVSLPLATSRDRLDVLLAHVHCPLFASCPVVSLIHDLSFARLPRTYHSWSERALMKRTIALSIRKSAGIIAVSEFTKAEICSLYGLPPERITVAPNGVDPLFSATTRSNNTPVEPPFFLSIGNLQPRKNLITLIRAYGKLLEGSPSTAERLVIVGQPGYRGEQVYREAQRLPQERVVFTGYVDDATLVSLLRTATAFAYPSVYEGFGLPAVEAMAVGTPVAAANIPVMREVAGQAALLVEPTDPGAWASALRHLSSDAELRERLQDAGRMRSMTYTWARSAQRVLAALESAAGSE